jgi:type I restriction enzyme S subunit
MLLSNLNLLAQAPGGVARLRELILTLAVQGKLVPQDAKDEPASELLKKIRAEKDRLIAEGKIKRDKPLAEIDDGKLPCGLPVGWTWARLSEIGDFGGGKTPSTQRADFWGGDIPWITPKDMKQLRLSGSEDKVTQLAVGDGLALIPPHSLLIVVRSGILRRTVPTAVNEVTTTINQDLKALVLVRPELVNYAQLIIRGFERFILNNLTKIGTTVESIQFDAFAAQAFPLPPLAEQSRIVTRVEELMRLCDALEAKGQLEATQHAQLVSTLLATLTDSETPAQLTDNWHRIATHFDLLLDRPEAVDALEQTILQLAVRGLLVPQDPQDEPASELLKKIRTEKDKLIAECKIKRDKPLPPIAEDEKPFALPEGWEWVRIDEIAEVQGGIQKTQLRRPVKEHYPYLRVANVQRDALRLGEIERFELTQEELNKWRLAAGDLLIVEGNGSADEIGRCAVWDGSIDPCVYQNHLIRVRCLQQDSMAFMKLFLNAPSGMEEMKRLAITTSGLYNLSVGKIRNYVVPVPPLAEQSRIVTRVAQLRRLCADLRQRLSDSQRTQAHLAEALVQEVA